MRITLEQAAMPPVNTVICLSGFHSLRDELRLMCYNHMLAWFNNRRNAVALAFTSNESQ